MRPCRPRAGRCGAAVAARPAPRTSAVSSRRSYHSLVRLILASASPRRAELLRAAGFEFDVVVTGVDETIRDGESPRQYVRRLSADKSAAAQHAPIASG